MSDREDREDAASMEMELAEIAEREAQVREIAPELANALRSAVRIIFDCVPGALPQGEVTYRLDWPLVSRTLDKLEEIEGH